MLCWLVKKLQSHQAYIRNSANATPYRSMWEMNATNVVCLSSNTILCNTRFAWWSSWLKSSKSAPLASANGLELLNYLNVSLERLKDWIPLSTSQWVAENRRSSSWNNLSKTGENTFVLNPSFEFVSRLSPTVSVTQLSFKWAGSLRFRVGQFTHLGTF